jgi:hypothetical protein
VGISLLEKNVDENQNPAFIGHMKTKIIGLILAFCFLAGAACFAGDLQIGSWKLNEAKSKIASGRPKNTVVVYEMVGDQVKVTIEGTDAKGKPTHSEWTGRFDGKDYPVTGDPTSDMRSYKRVNARTLDFAARKNRKVVVSGRIVVAANGKSRTVTSGGTTGKGKSFRSTTVYDKQ